MLYLYIPTTGDAPWQGNKPDDDDFAAVEAGECAVIRLDETSKTKQFELLSVESTDEQDGDTVNTVYETSWEQI